MATQHRAAALGRRRALRLTELARPRLQCKLSALEDTDVLIINQADYERILHSGFSGDLAKKIEALSEAR